jgi:5S rRNA maturation endonuclease (ribonuclease M5)
MAFIPLQSGQSEYRRILDALEHGGYGPGKVNGKEIRFRCPAHDDHTPSLDVSEGRDGKALLQCRSRGCKHDAILKALNFDCGANHQANGDGKPKRIVATYDYTDEAGKLLFQTVRFDPKDFRQRKPIGKNRWEWNINGCRKVPYRLPELKAAPQDCQVFIPEGEKDVESLRALGFVATCNPMGAGKWKLIDSITAADAFRDRRIVILPDNDEPGKNHANDVCQSLRTLAAEIIVLELPGLPVKGDVSDWIAAGGTKDELSRLVDVQGVRVDLESDRPYWQGESHEGPGETPTPIEPDRPRFKIPVLISQLVLPPQQVWRWEGFLKVDGISLLSALWKVGKTTLLSRLLLAFGRGGEFLGLPIQKANVLYVTEENDGEWVERRDKLGIGDHVHLLSQQWHYKPSAKDWQDWLDFLNDYRLAKNIGFTVFDTISTIWPIKNENDASEVNEALMPMRKLAKGQSVSVVHHLSKFDRGDGTGTRGSGALCGFVDVLTEMRRFGKQGEETEEGSEDDRRRVLTSFSRWDETPRKLVIRLQDDGTDYEAEGDGQEVRQARLVAELVKLLPDQEPGITADKAHELLPAAIRPKRAKVMQELQSGAAVGNWKALGTGKKGDPRRFWKC